MGGLVGWMGGLAARLAGLVIGFDTTLRIYTGKPDYAGRKFTQTRRGANSPRFGRDVNLPTLGRGVNLFRLRAT